MESKQFKQTIEQKKDIEIIVKELAKLCKKNCMKINLDYSRADYFLSKGNTHDAIIVLNTIEGYLGDSASKVLPPDIKRLEDSSRFIVNKKVKKEIYESIKKIASVENGGITTISESNGEPEYIKIKEIGIDYDSFVISPRESFKNLIWVGEMIKKYGV